VKTKNCIPLGVIVGELYLLTITPRASTLPFANFVSNLPSLTDRPATFFVYQATMVALEEPGDFFSSSDTAILADTVTAASTSRMRQGMIALLRVCTLPISLI
jgi:hypothetical protein